ncbi:MAG: hypothetical protein M3495_07155 [Pseudomonadota bacterium]|nr:hypothetical protein [Pseudomonadota bacterium]
MRHFESIRYSFVARVSKVVYHIVTEGGVLTPVGLVTDYHEIAWVIARPRPPFSYCH